VARFRDLVEAGVRYFLLMLFPGEIETIRLLGERLIPALQSSSASAESTILQAARRHWLPWGTH
jgi:hypothetical protein